MTKQLKKPINIILLFILFFELLYFATVVYAEDTDTNLTDLTILGSADCSDDERIYVVDDPNGTPLARAIARYEFLLGWAGSANITTLGTIATGTWNAGALTSSATITSSGTFDVTGANPMTLGSADVTSLTITTDGTGNAEFTMPNDVIGDADIDWGAGAGQIDADDIPESATNFWSASDGLGGNDTVKDTMVDWGAGANQIDLADIPGGTAGANTFNFGSATVTLPSRQAGNSHHFRVNLWNPNALYDDDTQICLCPVLPAAITITAIDVTCDADPDPEIQLDLKWADAFIGLANAAVIDELDTTNGVADIDAGFDDADVASGKCIYLEWQADPDAAITQVCVDVTYDYD